MSKRQKLINEKIKIKGKKCDRKLIKSINVELYRKKANDFS